LPPAWHEIEGHLSVAPISIRFERFTVFHTSPLVEVMILANKNLSFSGSCAEEDKKMTEEEAESAEIIS